MVCPSKSVRVRDDEVRRAFAAGQTPAPLRMGIYVKRTTNHSGDDDDDSDGEGQKGDGGKLGT